MTITYNVTGTQRKKLVDAISQIQRAPVKYLGAPTFAYEVGGFTIDKNGTVTGSDYRVLVGELDTNHGFIPVATEYDIPVFLADGVRYFLWSLYTLTLICT